jgi:putative ABC transport system permease protein
MLTATARKSLRDLTRRKARASFTALTLALAVASLGIFAVPSLLDGAMQEEVARSRQPDVTLTLRPLPLSDAQLAALERLPNVEAIEPRALFATQVWVGGRRERAIVVGVDDFARQRADLVSLDQGRTPGDNTLLSDQANDGKGFTGTSARLLSLGGVQALRVTGIGHNLTGGEDDPTNDWITFYATTATVERLSGVRGYSSLAVRLRDGHRAAAERSVVAIRDELRASTGFAAFDDLPVYLEPGDYPGRENVESLAGLLNIVTLLAVLSALVLVSSTMTTLIGEQTGEIAAMKAIGARRRDIRRLYLRTALLLGLAGAIVGAALGVVLANALAGFLGSLLYVDVGFGISVPVVIVSLVLGVAGPALAALPAIRRATRLPLAEALSAGRSELGGQGPLDSLLRRVRGLPRSAQIGLRGVARRPRRTAATIAQVALAVATLLSMLSLGAGVATTTRGWFDDNHFDIWAQSVASEPFSVETDRVIRATDGVRDAQGWVQNAARVDGRAVAAWGLPAQPRFATRMQDGRWFTDGEGRVAVLGRTLAKATGTAVGDRIRLDTSAGPATFRVIGVSGNQAENGDVVFVPVAALQSVLGLGDAVNSYWITTTRPDHALIDRTTTRLEDALAGRGHQVLTTVIYDAREKQVAANATLTTMITLLGLLLVAISMVALINTITMAVLERTREIGILRSVGARARDVRRIFATEGLILAVAGWAVGVPLGYGLARAIGWAVGEAVGLDVAFEFPPAYVAVALAGTVLLSLATMLAPLRRAVQLKPGDALRHT